MPLTPRSCAPGQCSCVVLFCKAPSRSKRRLAAALGDDATIAAEHLLACALEDLRAWPGPAALAVAEPADAGWLARAGHDTHEVVVQRGATLGERINHVDAALRTRGFDRLICIGADCPALDGGYLAAADAALDRADAVLGPAVDGGVVLMGARRAWPDLGDLPWSSSCLLGDLRERLERDGWTVALLDALPDVDSIEDLADTRARLANDERPARRALSAWLASFTPLCVEASS